VEGEPIYRGCGGEGEARVSGGGAELNRKERGDEIFLNICGSHARDGVKL
jgi:hypothetical protein